MKTDYIHPKVDISGRCFINALCSGVNKIKFLSNKCLDIDRACHTYFLGTGKSFDMNCYKFEILFICYIHFLTDYYYFCVQVQVSLLVIKRNTCINNSVEIILIDFWILQYH